MLWEIELRPSAMTEGVVPESSIPVPFIEMTVPVTTALIAIFPEYSAIPSTTFDAMRLSVTVSRSVLGAVGKRPLARSP